MKFLVLIIVLLSSLTLHASNFKTKRIKIDKNHQAVVYLPEHYQETTLHYPVIYIFDGQMLFDILVSLYRYNQDIYPAAIIVGVEQNDRGRELIDTGETNPGGNEFFYNLLSEKLFPLIQDKYRTNSIRVGIGHSHGGSFVLNAALKKGFFTAVIAISPTLWINQASFLKEYPFNAPAWGKIKKFYCAYGEQDFPVIQADCNRLFKSGEGLTVCKKETIKDEDHNSVIFTGMRKGVEFIFKDFIFSEEEWEEVEESQNDTLFYSHFDHLSGFWGEKIIPGEDDYNTLGYYYSENKAWEKAEKTFKEALYYYPFSANLYDSLGELYEKQQQPEAAKHYYQKALKIARKDKELQLMLPTYQEHLERVK